MTDESPAKRGDAAWKEARDEVGRRNADAHKRALGKKQHRAATVAASERAERDREAEQLHALNTRISKQQGRGHR